MISLKMDPYEQTQPPDEDLTPAGKPSNRGWITAIMIISLGLVIIGILILTWNASTVIKGAPASSAPPICSSLTTGLPAVDGNPCCVASTGIPSTYKPFNTQSTLNFIIGPTAQNYNTVCQQYCSPGSTFDQSTNTCSGFATSTDETNFNKCIALLNPVDCTGATSKPVATNNGIPFYAQSVQPGGSCPAGTQTCAP